MPPTNLLTRLYVLLVLAICGSSTKAQGVDVTFQVDMSNEVVSSKGVHIAGNFQSVSRPWQ